MEDKPKMQIETVSGEIIIAGSDVCEIKCEPCTDEGKYITADGFCQDCEEFLCSSCFIIHTKVRAYRKHMLLDKSQMPTTKSQKKVISGDDDICLQHKGEVIKFYCKHHCHVGCHACITIHHQNCQTVDISDLTKGLSKSFEFKDVCKSLSELNLKHKEHFRTSKQNVKEAQDYHKDAVVGIEQLHDMLNKSRKLTEDKAVEKKEIDINKLESVSRLSDTVMCEIGKLTVELESKHGASLFISMIKAKNHAKHYEESLRKLDQDNTIERYVFKSTDQIRTAFNNVLGHCESLPCKVSTISQKMSGCEYQNTTCLIAVNCGMFIIGASVNNGKNTIGRIAIMDNKFKLLVKSEIIFQTAPFALTTTENDQIIVTFPEENKIRLIGYTPQTLLEERYIEVSGCCKGIAFSKGTFIVSYSKPEKIEIIDLKKCTILKSYPLDHASITRRQRSYLSPFTSNAFSTIKNPSYVSINPDGTTLYVSEPDKVSSMTLQGRIKDCYNTGYGLTGVVFDDEGCPIVAGSYTSNIYSNGNKCDYCNPSVKKLSVSRIRNKNVEVIFQETDDQHSDCTVKAMTFKNNALFVVTQNEIKVIQFK